MPWRPRLSSEFARKIPAFPRQIFPLEHQSEVLLNPHVLLDAYRDSERCELRHVLGIGPSAVFDSGEGVDRIASRAQTNDRKAAFRIGSRNLVERNPLRIRGGDHNNLRP